MIPQRIVAIGTSSFFGHGDPFHGGFIGRLKVWHEVKDINNEVYNLGISGKTTGEITTSILQRLIPEVSRREPELILLTSGINDIKRYGGKDAPCATPQEKFRENIIEMIRQARSLADVVFISAVPIKEKLESSGNYLLPKDLDEYVPLVKDICEQENIPYLDIYSEWKKEDYFQWLIKDGVHPNEKGHEIIFESLKKFLEELYK